MLSAAGCAAPLCFRRPDRFRAACVSAAAVSAALWLPTLATLAIGTLASLAFGGGLVRAFIHVALATAGTATLVAAFQRSKGAEHGRRAVVVGSVAAALTLTGWACAALGRHPLSP
ncbi:hypothetical protein ABTY61_02200 [Kitasatospora sp. NPDC096128]|uniref:hypothetical protein n=1 Tax=Kitasatospora sp. NPDC096128 TaxID=3155547 RepID=UPI003328B7F3